MLMASGPDTWRPLVVRPAMHGRRGHAAERLRRRRSAASLEHAVDAAHGLDYPCDRGPAERPLLRPRTPVLRR
jgi:hypothetical protein